MLDIAALAEVSHRHGCLLAVDNAHGAYLKYLPESRHPMDLGADLCCDSAHKTLPVLTGGAYLHASPALSAQAKDALALFGSTSPSYLILQSLDAANRILACDYRTKLLETAKALQSLKSRLPHLHFIGDEPCKLTVETKAYGYTGTELAAALRCNNIECEFADPDYIVFMFTPETGTEGLGALESALAMIPKRDALSSFAPCYHVPRRITSIREAILSPGQIIPVERAEGRVLSAATVGCPPAVPIAVCGEQIDREIIERFRYYGIDTCCVVSE